MKNTERFSGKAEIYAQFRPAYPKELIDDLVALAGLRAESRIGDIGSGTGIFTAQLLLRGFLVYAVEPNTDMRRQAEEALSRFSGFESIAGTAEATTLPLASLDLITAAQAFHWFDLAAFRAECQRILKENAPVALIWNSREPEHRIVKANAELFRKYCPAFKGFSGGIDENPGRFKLFFRNGEYRLKTYDNPLTFDLESFLGRNFSSSYAPDPDSPAGKKLTAELTLLFQDYQDPNKLLRYPNYTRCYSGLV